MSLTILIGGPCVDHLPVKLFPSPVHSLTARLLLLICARATTFSMIVKVGFTEKQLIAGFTALNFWKVAPLIMLFNTGESGLFCSVARGSFAGGNFLFEDHTTMCGLFGARALHCRRRGRRKIVAGH